MGRPTRTLLRKKELGLNIQRDLDLKTNKNFGWKGGIGGREMKPRNGKGKRGGRKRNGQREGI